MKLNNKSPKLNDNQKRGPFGLNLNFSLKKKPEPGIDIDPETFVFTPTLPTVNAIPASLTEKYEIRGVVRQFLTIGAILVAAIILVFGGSTLFVTGLNMQLDTIKAEEATIKTQVDALLPYEEYKTAIEAKRTALSEEVSTDVNMGTLYNDLYQTSQANSITLTNISIQQADLTAEGADLGCTNPEPFSEAQNLIGCITLSGEGPTPEGGRVFIDQLVDVEGGAKYTNPFISSVTIGDEATTFEATVFFTDQLYTGQYSELQLALEDLLASNTPATGDGTTSEIDTPDATPTVTFNSIITTQASELVPQLTEEDLIKIDTEAVNACETGDITTAMNNIESVLTSRLPADDTNIEEYKNQLTTSLTTECEGA